MDYDYDDDDDDDDDEEEEVCKIELNFEYIIVSQCVPFTAIPIDLPVLFSSRNST